jgi:hypothetical protein
MEPLEPAAVTSRLIPESFLDSAQEHVVNRSVDFAPHFMEMGDAAASGPRSSIALLLTTIQVG